MDKLIEALQIFLQYKNEEYPTNCGHDALYIMGVHRDMVSDADHKRLEELDFIWDEDEEVYFSFHFGSA